MNIAILYICTGEYSIFWNNFYESSEKFFMKSIQKHYFVFTDDESIINSNSITKIYKKSRGFPLDSLFRFEMFWSIRNLFEGFDYTFFFNSNMQFNEYVGFEILPMYNSSGLVALLHPSLYLSNPRSFPYERNKKSLAYIPNLERNYKYFMGSLNGGKTSSYLQLISECMKNIQIDFDNDIIAIFHDESHLNRYLYDKEDVLELMPSYGYPEYFHLPMRKKIIMLEKTRFSSFFSKNKNKKLLISRIKRKFLFLYHYLVW